VRAIEIVGLEKVYQVGFWRKRPKRALNALHLAVEQGEIFGFLGPNGAGKTTTLKMLMGLVFPTGGSARILDMEMDDPRMKAQIGFLPEQPYFYDYLTARELLRYYGHLSGVEPKHLTARVDTVLNQVGLNDSRNECESSGPVSMSQRFSSGSRPLNSEPSTTQRPRSTAAVTTPNAMCVESNVW